VRRVRILSAQAFSNLARPYAAARAEARISSSFLFASFVHSFAFRRRNLRSCSSWVRAAYHSHWRTCSKHSAMVDMVVSDHGPCLIPVDQVTRTLRVWLRSVRLRQPRNTHRYPSRKRKSPSWATGASIPRECVARSEGHPPSSAMIMIQRTPSHPVPCWLRNYSAVTRQRCSGSLAMLSPCAAPRRESNPAASPFVPVVHVAQRLAVVVAHDEAAPLCL
jgi:hypothetical protein